MNIIDIRKLNKERAEETEKVAKEETSSDLN